jgi:hypothetical protein
MRSRNDGIKRPTQRKTNAITGSDDDDENE